ncbi:MAG: tRNA (N(6)-L-threonylcarbamoyladenosine(37)-C(2))-methylthiotransferase MtaB [Alphaproteobacteria bacterium]|jgi:threonylcarbamoyladenosine tRNA methylthiotransferase MtaB|nr:tRNA (N(6)-L-threonylcarbamoyladenosine(37)-C(2))-methylthiotransferase MtaB [Alphaproteobacteria bacterium]
MSRVEVVNFGCRLNIAEGEAIREAASGVDDTGPELIIINSCAVTAEAERQARQTIRRLKRDRPEARIIVTGCAAETSAASFAQMAEVEGVVPNAEKRKPMSFGLPFDGANALRPAVSGADHARAFIEVQNGCDHDCTFCVTTLARGASRSVPAGAVIDAVQAAMDRGQREVILTGVDLTSYGADLPGTPNLGQLVDRILRHVPQLERLRLSSMDSIEIDDRLFDLITQEPRMMPHVHLSLQSGDDMILKRMKRRHLRADAIRLVERLKTARPEIAIGADIIAGFPTEDEAMFANSLDLLSACDVVFGHIFPYSPRPGTAAARMPQLGRDVARARAEILRANVAARKAKWLSGLVGTQQRVLVELDGKSGHAENHARVEIIGGRDFRYDADALKGRVMTVTITASTGDHLIGDVYER